MTPAEARRPPRLAWMLAALAAGGMAGGAPAETSAQTTADVELGRRIYRTGESPGEAPITATLGNQSYPLPGEALPCVSCHGPDGRGRPEGGAEPSNITWESLTRPYEVESSTGRRHGPYDRRLLIRAITLGVDPAGNPLHVAMPRFRLSKADAEALAAYIEHLGKERDPGLSETRVRIGMLLPEAGRLAGAGDAVEAVVRGLFEEVNAAGGVFGRELELVARRGGNGVEERLAALDELLAGESVFALVAPFTSGADAELARRTDAAQLPVIGPITQTPRPAALAGSTFYLLSGIDQQVRVLWDFAAGRVAPRALAAAIVSPGGEPADSAVEAIRRQARAWQAPAPKLLLLAAGFDPRALAADLRGLDVVFFLGAAAEGAPLLAELERSGEAPDLLIPGPLAGDLIDRRSPRLYFGFPDLPGQPSAGARSRWQAFARRHRLPAGYATTQRLASVAASLLVGALRATGRDLTRAGLVASLEELYKVQTGWTPPITYGPNRRIGALGGYVVQVADDPTGFARVTGWIEPR